MSRQSKHKTNPTGTKAPGRVSVRKATRSETKDIVDLIIRLKKLNSEFDPLFGVVADAKQKAEKYVLASFESNKTLLMVITTGDKIIGVLRAEIEERLFYNPSREGHITEMYILPEYRRMQLGREFLEEAMNELKKMGAEIIVADLPIRNEIGFSFYTKRGFRRLTETFAQIPQ